MGAVAGPVFGPIVGGFAAAAKGWSWPIWELGWISGFSAVFLVFFLPETLPGTILLKRARRLRKLTGNDRLRSMSEIEQAGLSASAVAAEYLIRPFQLMLEPAILFINIYIGREYGRSVTEACVIMTDLCPSSQLRMLCFICGSNHSPWSSSISTTSKVVCLASHSSALLSVLSSPTSATYSISSFTSDPSSPASTSTCRRRNTSGSPA